MQPPKSILAPLRPVVADARKALIRHAFSLARIAGVTVTKKAAVEPFLATAGRRLDHGVYELRVGPGVRALEINRAGVLRVNRHRLLEIDYDARQGLTGWRPHRRVERCVHLWSQRWLGYYHWLIDVAPKICAAQEVYGRDLGGFKLCWPKIKRAYEEQTLALLEVPPAATVDTNKLGGLSAEVCACMPISGWGEPPHLNIHLLRKRLAARFAEPDGRRLFIIRAGTRACVNQPEVLDVLTRHGFQAVDFEGMSVAEQVRLTSAAGSVGGFHGAGLSNILWCQPGTTVIDLLPPDYQPKWFANLSESLKLCYHPIAAQPGARQEAHWTQMYDSYAVDVAALQAALAEIF